MITNVFMLEHLLGMANELAGEMAPLQGKGQILFHLHALRIVVDVHASARGDSVKPIGSSGRPWLTKLQKISTDKPAPP